MFGLGSRVLTQADYTEGPGSMHPKINACFPFADPRRVLNTVSCTVFGRHKIWTVIGDSNLPNEGNDERF